MPEALKHGAIMVLVAGCWVASVNFSKRLQDDCMFVKPYLISYLHEVALGVFCAPVAFAATKGDTRRLWSIARELTKKACCIGILAFASNGCFTAALHFAEASTAMTLEQLCTVFVAGFSYALLREKYTLVQLLGLTIAVVGAMVTAQAEAKASSKGAQPWLGNTLVIIASAGAALYMVVLKMALGGATFNHVQLLVFFVVKGVGIGAVGALGFVFPLDRQQSAVKPCAWAFLLANVMAAVGFNFSLALGIFVASPLASRLFLLLGLPLSLLVDIIQGMPLRIGHVAGMALVMLGVSCFEGSSLSQTPREGAQALPGEDQELTNAAWPDDGAGASTTTSTRLSARSCCLWSGKRRKAAIAISAISALALVTGAVGWIMHLASRRHSRPLCADTYMLPTLGHNTWRLPDASSEVQRLFDEALLLCYGFNHDEALRSVRKALALAPKEPMLYWLQAYALGGNLNRPLSEASRLEDAKTAAKHMVSAARAADRRPLTFEEQILVDAMQKRFPASRSLPEPFTWVTGHDIAYYEALEEGRAALPPTSEHFLALLGQAAMETTPWSYYDAGGQLKAVAQQAFNAFDAVLKWSPHHALALHYIIHLLEAQRPEPRASLDAAATLSDLFGRQGPGHLSHMPSHAFFGAGDYHSSSESNQMAIAADSAYFEACEEAGVGDYNAYYKMLYHCHKHAALLASLELEGRARDASAALDNMTVKCHIDFVGDHLGGVFATYGHEAERHLLMVRFGKWDEILQLRDATVGSAASSDFGDAILHFARTTALAAKGTADTCGQADDEKGLFLEAMQRAASMSVFQVTRLNSTLVKVTMGDVLRVANSTLSARLAASCEPAATSVSVLTFWQQAVEAASLLPYFEPPFWRLDPQLCLGEHQRLHGQLAQAEAAFHSHLQRFPRSGWGLFGLWKVAEAEGVNSSEIGRRKDAFHAVWQYADLELSTACY